MIKIINYIVATIAIILLHSSHSVAQQAKVFADRVIASVDGEPFTLQDLRQYVSSLGNKQFSEVESSPELLKKYLNDMLTEHMLNLEAKQASIEVGDGEVKKYIDEIKRLNNLNDQQLISSLSANGTTFDQYLGQVRSDLLRTKLAHQKVRAKIAVSEEDIESYLDEHPKLRPRRGQVHVQQLVFSEQENKQETKQIVEQVRESILQGAKIEEVKQGHYDDLGFVDAKDLRDEFSDIVKKLKVGELSEVISIPQGYVLLRVTEKSKKGEIGEQTKQAIQNDLIEHEFKSKLESYLEELPKKHVVETKI